ncbi:MAG: hypothetical protein KDK97_00995 [Verrucomicrobiales bacterium]|nr:hypothetical protein [Verrucomicrobiales bacterium]MCP5560577.1 hypothetical protein [Verrucomicrobiaceae bacterium]
MLNPNRWSLIAGLVLLASGAATTVRSHDVYVKASNTKFFSKFGQSIAMSGSTLVVGSPYEKSGSAGVNGDQNNTNGSQTGAVYVYVRNGTEWVQQAYLKASNPDIDDHFGQTVAISGNTIVVGAPDEDSAAQSVNGDQANNDQASTGAAYVFVRTGTSWVQQAYLKGSNIDSLDSFGVAVAIDGNTIAVGADGEQSGSGSAYIFVRKGSTWTQQARLRASNANNSDGFGSAVALTGNTLVVGAPFEDSRASDPTDNSAPNAGAAYVFGRKGTAWTEQTILKTSTTYNDNGDLFGCSAAIYADTVVIGARGEASNATGVNGDRFDNSFNRCGAAFVFRNQDDNWVLQGYLKGKFPAAFNDFGASVAIHRDRILVGCPGDDLGIPNTTEMGASYLFERSENYWGFVSRLSPAAGNYSKAYNNETGTSVALWGDVAAVGAPGEAGSSTGTHGDISQDGQSDAGAAFVFYVGARIDGVAKTGTTAPGGPSIVYSKIGDASVDPSAQGGILFQAAVSGPGAPAGQTQAMFNLDRFSSLTWMSMRTGTPVGGLLGLPSTAKVSSLSNPVNTGSMSRGWFTAMVGSSKVVFVDDQSTVSPVIRTGQLIPALGNRALASIREVLPATHTDQTALLYTLKGATAASDSGLLIVDRTGAVVNATLREGSSFFGMGSATFGQFIHGTQVHSNTRFIAKMIPGPGQTAKDAICTPTQATGITQGDLAAGTSAGERYRSFLGLGRASIFGLFRATLTNCPTATNEGLWLDSGAPVARKGQDIGNGIKIARILRVWGNDAPEFLLHVVLSGTGVTPANNVALVAKPHTGAFKIVARTGFPVPDMGDPNIKIRSFAAVDAATAGGHFILLANLSGAPASSNQVLLAGRATPSDNPVPHVILRKGDLLHTALTPSSVITGISVRTAPDVGAVATGSRRTQVNAGWATALVTLSSGAKELIRFDLSFL